MRPDQTRPPQFAVRGLGLRLPGVLAPADLAGQIAGVVPAPRTRRRFAAARTDLVPLDQWVYGPVEARMPAGVPTRGLRNLPEESLLALAAAAEAAEAATAPVDGPTSPSGGALGGAGEAAAVVWASSSAGLAEYATICVEASVLDPGLSSPIIGPASAFNGPAATISIRLGLRGPNETLTGGTTAGLSSVVEAGRLLAEGAAARALVGASATASRWSLPGAAGGYLPAEGAACLALEPRRPGDGGVVLGRCRRVGLDPSRLVTQVREFVTATVAETGEPAAIVVSALDETLVGALSARRPGPVWHVERALGDFGAAGGLMALACAVAHCAGLDAGTLTTANAATASGRADLGSTVSQWAEPGSTVSQWAERISAASQRAERQAVAADHPGGPPPAEERTTASQRAEDRPGTQHRTEDRPTARQLTADRPTARPGGGAPPATVLALALEPSGNASIVEVWSC